MKTDIIDIDRETFGGRMRIARVEAGMTLRGVEGWLEANMPPAYWATDSKIHRIESGAVAEDEADPVLVAVLAMAYGVPISDLSGWADRATGWVFNYLRWAQTVGVDTEVPANPSSSLIRKLDGLLTQDWDGPNGLDHRWVARGSNPEPTGSGARLYEEAA